MVRAILKKIFGKKDERRSTVTGNETVEQLENQTSDGVISTNISSRTVTRTSSSMVSERIQSFERSRLTASLSSPEGRRINFPQTDALPFNFSSPKSITYQQNRPSTSKQVLSPGGAKIPLTAAIQPKNSNTRKEFQYPYKVKKTKTFHDQIPGDRLPVYSTHSKKRGEVLLLNNVKFHNEKHLRRGAEKDEKDLADVLTQIGFRVHAHRDLNLSNMKKTLDNFSKKDKLKDADICLVVIMSHGTNRGIPGGYTEVLCTDNKGILTDDIIDYFDGVRCPNLRNKPKIFIFQCCRGTTQTDAVGKRKKASDRANTLIAHSTIPGFSSTRDPVNGTWYIQTLCQVLSNYAHQFHIEELLKLVDQELKNMNVPDQQVTCYENRSFSRCYLHPC